MKRGFTLIELLAVIVILAIIALIATPIILGIINDARTEAKERSAELVVTGVEYAVTQYMYKNEGKVPTTLADIKPYFDVENVTLADTGKVTEEGADTAFCTVAPVTVGEDTKFTVDCGSYLKEVAEVLATN